MPVAVFQVASPNRNPTSSRPNPKPTRLTARVSHVVTLSLARTLALSRSLTLTLSLPSYPSASPQVATRVSLCDDASLVELRLLALALQQRPPSAHARAPQPPPQPPPYAPPPLHAPLPPPGSPPPPSPAAHLAQLAHAAGGGAPTPSTPAAAADACDVQLTPLSFVPGAEARRCLPTLPLPLVALPYYP